MYMILQALRRSVSRVQHRLPLLHTQLSNSPVFFEEPCRALWPVAYKELFALLVRPARPQYYRLGAKNPRRTTCSKATPSGDGTLRVEWSSLEHARQIRWTDTRDGCREEIKSDHVFGM